MLVGEVYTWSKLRHASGLHYLHVDNQRDSGIKGVGALISDSYLIQQNPRIAHPVPDDKHALLTHFYFSYLAEASFSLTFE